MTIAPGNPPVASLAPEGRKLLRLEVRNAQTPIERKPEWIKTRAKMGPEYTELKALVKREGLHTVCEEAGCPNIYECWEDREATFLIGGDQCTRRCDFCQIDTGKPADARPRRAAPGRRVASRRWACATPRSPASPATTCPTAAPGCTPRPSARSTSSTPAPASRLLIPDFNAKPDQLAEVFASRPEVLAHNVETVPRIFKRIRPGFRYERSPRRHHRRPRGRAGHQVQPDPRAWARTATRSARRCATCTTPAATCITITQYLRPSRGTTPWSAGSSPRSSSSSRPRPSRSASPASWPGRWSAPRTAPAASTSRPSAPAGRSRPGRAHLRRTAGRCAGAPSWGMARAGPRATVPRRQGRARFERRRQRPYPGASTAARSGQAHRSWQEGCSEGGRRRSSRTRPQIWQAFQMRARTTQAPLAADDRHPGRSLAWSSFLVGILLGSSGSSCRSASSRRARRLIIFGRRVQKTVYKQAEGQPGAAAWALENMRGEWRVTPASPAPPSWTPFTG